MKIRGTGINEGGHPFGEPTGYVVSPWLVRRQAEVRRAERWTRLKVLSVATLAAALAGVWLWFAVRGVIDFVGGAR